MSALLDDLRSYKTSVGLPQPVPQQTVVSSDEQLSTGTEGRAVSAKAVRSNFLSSVRRRVYDVPELDISAPTARAIAPSAIVATAIQGHAAASQLLAEWHGQVADIGETSFTAQLRGRFGEGVVGSEDEAVIPIEDVREEDRELFSEGAFFSLCISYEVNAAGTKRRFTEVIFRRMPAFRRDELEVAAVRAKELVRGLRLE